MQSNEEELTAYHEAGHVVMAIKLGARIVHATIDPPHDDGLKRYGETITSWPAMTERQLLHAEISISLAGPTAEMLYANELRSLNRVAEWRADWSRASQAANRLNVNQSDASRLLETSTEKVLHFLESENGWAAVGAIADLMMAHETVEHDQCSEAVCFWLPDCR